MLSSIILVVFWRKLNSFILHSIEGVYLKQWSRLFSWDHPLICSSRSEEHVGPLSDIVFRLSEGGALVILACPLDVSVRANILLLSPRCSLFWWSPVLIQKMQEKYMNQKSCIIFYFVDITNEKRSNFYDIVLNWLNWLFNWGGEGNQRISSFASAVNIYLPLLRCGKGGAIGGLASPIRASESRHVSALVEWLSLVLRYETSLVGRHSKVIDSVGVPEETVVLWVLLHVPPSTTLPPARYQVKLLPVCRLHVRIHFVQLVCVNHFCHVLASNGTACVGSLIDILAKISLLSALECRCCF